MVLTKKISLRIKFELGFTVDKKIEIKIEFDLENRIGKEFKQDFWTSVKNL